VNPSILQVNPKFLLSEIGRGSTLDDIPDSFFDAAAEHGFDWIWLLGVWTLGAAGREISRSRVEWRSEYRAALPDLNEDDICGSPFAVCDYTPSVELGGAGALARFRQRLSSRGVKLLLDFVPNHVALDHPWTVTNPEYFIRGSDADLANAPSDWVRLPNDQIVAHGRDPYFPGWPDTLQLNFYNTGLRSEVVQQLVRVATMCDGVRCDMAMLLEPEVFSKTWPTRATDPNCSLPIFWPEAIATIKSKHPHFTFIAEVYWGYEGRLQEHGFDFTYDKMLYDRIIESSASATNALLRAPLSYQQRMVHFLENHDEPRIAGRVSFDHACAAAVITYLAPGMRFFQRGQFEGARIKTPIHLRRAALEATSPRTKDFYSKLLPIVQSPLAKNGTWQPLESTPAWPGNHSCENFVSYLLSHAGAHLLVSVNLSPYRAQCRLALPCIRASSTSIEFSDLLTKAAYQRTTDDLVREGLFVELDGYACHILSFSAGKGGC
jgi:hypothetical protein